MKMKEYKTHPLADLFPMMPAAELKSLQDDIKENGLAHPITLHEDKILDGRHRYEACLNVGVKPRFVEFAGDDPLAFVLSANLKRRHLSVGERAAIALKISQMQPGKRTDREPLPKREEVAPTQKEAAARTGVSAQDVSDLKKVADESPALFKKVATGSVSLGAAVTQVAEARKKAAVTEPRKDGVGRIIPEDCLADWDRAVKTASQLRSCASEIKVTVERGLADKDLIFSEITNPTIAEAASLAYTLSQIAPYAVCPCCQGKLKSKCQLCHKRGFISRYLWQSPAVSEETKRMIAKVVAK